MGAHRQHGNKELVAGSTLYIPVYASGALFSVGDGHAAQGDGEVCVTAMETSLRGTFQLIVRKDMKLDWPRAETPTDYMTMGFNENLTDATKIAVEQMIDLLIKDKHLDRSSATSRQQRDEPAYHAAGGRQGRRPRAAAKGDLQVMNCQD